MPFQIIEDDNYVEEFTGEGCLFEAILSQVDFSTTCIPEAQEHMNIKQSTRKDFFEDLLVLDQVDLEDGEYRENDKIYVIEDEMILSVFSKLTNKKQLTLFS